MTKLLSIRGFHDIFVTDYPRNALLIAHRLSTIRDADLTLVMEDSGDRRAGHPA